MTQKVGRNDPCPCKSGKKYKFCCLAKNQERTTPAMPERPRQHELDTEAVRYIQSQLPTGWTSEEVQHDYGRDLRVEIFEKGVATAMDFWVQAKGHEKFRIVNSDQIAQPLSVSALNYYVATLSPVLLVSYSAEEKRACYLWIKPHLTEVLDKQKPGWQTRAGNSEITLHIPARNQLNGSAHQALLNHVDTEYASMQMQKATLPPSSGQRWSVPGKLFASPRLLPPKIPQYLHRPRLVDLLVAGMEKSSVFVHTDAGYGKTWLIKDTVDSIKPTVCVWYTFDDSAIEGTHFIGELAYEISRQSNAQLRTLTYLLEQGKEALLDEVVATLIDEIGTLGQEVWLILEDVHAVLNERTNPAIQALLTKRPKNLRLIITSRLPLPFGEAKLVSQGAITIIDRDQVAFRPEETRDYLDKVLHVSMSPEQLDYLYQRTDGWIAAIGLAGNALKDKSAEFVSDLFERLTGYKGNVYNFFAEEVYGRFDLEKRRLLCRLGIARDIVPGIVDLFTGSTDGGQVLKELVKRNTFLLEGDDVADNYHFHSLFAEFLQTRFRDEEGETQVQAAHRVLAQYYRNKRDWYPLFDHALKSEDYNQAVEALEHIGPVGASAGFGFSVLERIEQIPPDWIDKSAGLQEVKARCALQVGDLKKAAEAASKARSSYELEKDDASVDRTVYLLAEIGYSAGDATAQSFVKTVRRVVRNSYQRNDTFFAAQIELRMIEVGQTLTIQDTNLLQELIRECGRLVTRLEKLGTEFSDIRARALSVQAHLTFEATTFLFQNGLSRIKVRESAGQPIPLDQRITLARQALQGWKLVSSLYAEAEKLASPKNEIERALIRLNRVADYVHHDAMLDLANTGNNILKSDEGESETKQFRYSCLAILEECAQVFSKYHITAALAACFCDAADLYDVLGDVENRDRLAHEALELASAKGLPSVIHRAERLLSGKVTYSSVRRDIENAEPNDRSWANMTDADKSSFVDAILRSFSGDTNVEQMRRAIETSVDDLVANAKKRLTWCQHIQLLEDLRHTRSLSTFYQQVPSKVITCDLLGFRSPRPAYSFEKLWPEFEAFYCLACLHRSLAK